MTNCAHTMVYWRPGPPEYWECQGSGCGQRFVLAERCLSVGCTKPTICGAFCEEHNAKVPTDEQESLG